MKTSGITTLFFLMLCASAIAQPTATDITVRLNPARQNEILTIEELHSGNPTPIHFDARRDAFAISFVVEQPDQREAKTKPIWRKYVVATSDASQRQTVFVKAGIGVIKEINLDIIVPNVKRDSAAISAIDYISSTEYRGLLRKYFEARAFYRLWADQNTNQIAIQSAKIWFDAAYNLATRQKSAFAMDPDITAILEGYEDKAKADPNLMKRLRGFVKPGYIRDSVAQINVRDFEVLRLIPELIRGHNLAEAKQINDYYIERFAALDSESQATVVRLQKITPQLLESNRAYIETLCKASQKPTVCEY